MAAVPLRMPGTAAPPRGPGHPHGAGHSHLPPPVMMLNTPPVSMPPPMQMTVPMPHMGGGGHMVSPHHMPMHPPPPQHHQSLGDHPPEHHHHHHHQPPVSHHHHHISVPPPPPAYHRTTHAQPPQQQPPQQPPPQQQPPQQQQFFTPPTVVTTTATAVVPTILSPTCYTSTKGWEIQEKTPMCLINELARYNKIPHQYRLTDESGPAHKKTFTVCLKLGGDMTEEYLASGPSIKKAQHAAAAIALEKTKFKHPPPKNRQTKNMNVTPTVELNALAMKRGEATKYTFLDPPRIGPNGQIIPPNLNFRGIYNQRYHYPAGVGQPNGVGGKVPAGTPVFYVCLNIGHREFYGEGSTAQAAKHTAASKALKVLKDLPLPESKSTLNPASLPFVPGSSEYDELKSPISLVHETALKRNLTVKFKVTRETGPPHMRTFITKCIVGEFVTEGEGNGKKASKKRAADLMLEQLKILPPLASCLPPKPPRKVDKTKKKSRNLIKLEQKASPEYGQSINPISRLIQIQQAKREKEPVYTLISERGMPRRREFIMQVQVGGQTATGTGPNKKLAKRAAAENLLQILGYSRPQPQPAKPAIKTTNEQPGDKNRKLTFLDDVKDPVVNGVNGVNATGQSRQIVPGLIYLDANQSQKAKQPQPTNGNESKKIVEVSANSNHATVGSKDQLMYLSQLLGFTVTFSDFPNKENKSEYLTLVSLSTEPPQVCHGKGPTIESSHNCAAMNALRCLADAGIDSVKKKKTNVDNTAAATNSKTTGNDGSPSVASTAAVSAT